MTSKREHPAILVKLARPRACCSYNYRVGTLRYRGTEANMIVLRNELEQNPALRRVATLEMMPVDANDRAHSLEHGALVDLTITIASSVAASGTYDSLKAAVRRAMNRGHVEDHSDPDGDDDAGAPGT